MVLRNHGTMLLLCYGDIVSGLKYYGIAVLIWYYGLKFDGTMALWYNDTLVL